MKKLISFVMAVALLTGCSEPLQTPEKTYSPYGILNDNQKHDNKVCYGASVGGIILSVLLSETIIVPIYIIGFDVMQPTRLKSPSGSCDVRG
jgi:hypothetical protein